VDSVVVVVFCLLLSHHHHVVIPYSTWMRMTRDTKNLVVAVVAAMLIIADEIRGCQSWQQYNRTDR